MSVHIDTNDPRYRQSAAEILRRHDKGEPEANITSAVRNFLTVTGLVKAEEIDKENPPLRGVYGLDAGMGDLRALQPVLA